MSTTTVRSLVDSARARHWSFSNLVVGDGAGVLFLNSRLRTHLAVHGAKIEGLIGTSVEYTTNLTGPTLLITNTGSILTTNFGVGIQVNLGVGQPAIGSAYEDGWATHSLGGIPYVDFSEAPIAGDPFGTNGGTPGFPLPTDMIRLINVSLVYNDPVGLQIPCDVIPEAQRFSSQPGRNPTAFLAGNRLVPVQVYNDATLNSGDRWSNVTDIQISYVAIQQLASLDDVLNIPTVLTEALIADLAQYFAMLAKECPSADKRLFIDDALKAGALIAGAALDIVNEPQQNSVQYKGR